MGGKGWEIVGWEREVEMGKVEVLGKGIDLFLGTSRQATGGRRKGVVERKAQIFFSSQARPSLKFSRQAPPSESARYL